MSMTFRYTPFRSRSPVWTLDNRLNRPRPVITMTVIGPAGSTTLQGLLDTGADDTVFEETVAGLIGIDLMEAPTASASGVGLVSSVLRLAEVTLRLASNGERREWPARVAFTSTPLKRALLGFAGFLQFFHPDFDGEQEQVELRVNGIYPGT